MALDVRSIRKDFPALERRHLDRPVVYLDNACTTLKPRQVIAAMNRYYEEFPGCHGRVNHLFGRETTAAFQAARATLQGFVNARHVEEIVFTKNATEGLNLLAHSLPLAEGDVVLCSDAEHNSNLLPWLAARDRTHATVRVVPTRPDTTFDLDALAAAMSRAVKVVAVPHVSNLSGVAHPVKEIARLAHRFGARVVVDGTQAVSHRDVDVRDLDVDAYVFSAHKMLGPTGVGCLYGKRDLLAALPPFLVGGETVVDVTYEDFALAEVPGRFEAGVQNYAGALGFAAAVEYLRRLKTSDVRAHLLALNARLTDALARHPRIRLIGPEDPALRGGIFDFAIDRVSSFDMVRMLDSAENIMLRAGRHCVHSWFNDRGVTDSIRVSMYVYNTVEEIDLLVTRLRDILAYF